MKYRTNRPHRRAFQSYNLPVHHRFQFHYRPVRRHRMNHPACLRIHPPEPLNIRCSHNPAGRRRIQSQCLQHSRRHWLRDFRDRILHCRCRRDCPDMLRCLEPTHRHCRYTDPECRLCRRCSQDHSRTTLPRHGRNKPWQEKQQKLSLQVAPVLNTTWFSPAVIVKMTIHFKFI